MLKKIILIPALALSLSACQGNGEGFGTIIGGIIGGVVGSEVTGGDTGGIIVGSAIGAAIGNNVGAELDEADRIRQQYAFQQAMEYNQTGNTSEWYNPDSGNSGSYVPQEAYQVESGAYCREFTQTVQIGGEDQEMYGNACRQPDGSWKIDKDNTRSTSGSNANYNNEPNYKKH